MPLFTTKDLQVSKVDLPTAYDESGVNTRFFIDRNDGKGITSAPTLSEAIEFAKAYQKLLG